VTAAVPAPRRSGLLEKLMAGVRPEFRAEVLLPDPSDPLLGVQLCVIDGCDRPKHERGFCIGHSMRWRRLGRPDLEEFIADPGPPIRGRSEPSSCTVPGCRFCTSGQGLCLRHRDKWSRSGKPDVAQWISTSAEPLSTTGVECKLSFCALWVEGNSVFCKSHSTRWRNIGSPDIEEFTADCERHGMARIDLRGLAPQLKLEFQYAVQTRFDQQGVNATYRVVMWAVRRAVEAGASSLLDLSEEEWREIARSRTTNPSNRSRREAFLLFARESIENLRDGSGWEVEYHRDIWRLRNLPGLRTNPSRPRHRSHLRFDRIAQTWLRDLGKRWVRWRLTSGLSVATAVGDVQALTRFSEFLTATSPHITGLGGIDRPLLERYLAWVSGLPGGTSSNESRVNGLNLFFQAIRQHGWDDTLPTTAAFYTGDCPRRRQRLTRHLAEHIMAQVEKPSNLDHWPDAAGRLVTLILIRCGLRVSDACTLKFDCLIHDGQNAPYLRYWNNKMSREAAVPIDEDLEAEVRAQQGRVQSQWPDGVPYLFPRKLMNPYGKIPLASDSYRGTMLRWLTACDVRDEHGKPVHLTPHQWRHTFATRLINRDVPQEVIRVLLDHESTQMTAHYAKMTDQTVRRRWEEATKVNIMGERVSIDPEGPLAQAQWAKMRYGIATQTLPNGYCGLPVQKTCPHANACLTCPVFLTGPEFLPELRQQHRRTLTVIENARSCGHDRIAEMNQQVIDNLDRMIGEIETDEKAADAG
jgi:integrase